MKIGENFPCAIFDFYFTVFYASLCVWFSNNLQASYLIFGGYAKTQPSWNDNSVLLVQFLFCRPETQVEQRMYIFV